MIRTVVLSLMIAGWAGTTAHAEDDMRHKDRGTFNRLASQIRSARGKLATAQAKALAHAHRNNGEVPDPLKAEIVSLQDEIDRKKNRIELVALRHGWEIPDFDAESVVTAARTPGLSRKEVFSAADRLINDALRGEAYEIAAGLTLPVISFNM